MSLSLSTNQTLRELLSASAADPALRRRLKTHAHAVLADWGVVAPGRRVYFVEPGEAPVEGRPGETFIELPAPGPALSDDALDVVAGGWSEARDRAFQAVDKAMLAADWRASNPWL